MDVEVALWSAGTENETNNKLLHHQDFVEGGITVNPYAVCRPLLSSITVNCSWRVICRHKLKRYKVDTKQAAIFPRNLKLYYTPYS